MDEKDDWRELYEECKETGWTIKALHHHIYKMMEAHERLNQERIKSIREAHAARIDTAEAALKKAEEVLSLRLDALNELRGVVADQQARFADKDKTDYRLEKLETAHNKLETAYNVHTGRSFGASAAASASGQVIAIVISIVAVAIAAFAVLK